MNKSLISAALTIAVLVWSGIAWAPPGSYSGNVEVEDFGGGGGVGSGPFSLTTLLLSAALGIGTYVAVWYTSARFGIIWLPVLVIGGYVIVSLFV